MPLNNDLRVHLTPAQVHEVAASFAALLRALFNHPDFKYLEPPTAQIYKIDADRTFPGLFWTTDFIERTYIETVIPFLPQGASRKCKDYANPWAYADPTYQWEWTWDAAAAALKDSSGATIEFPKLSKSQLREKIGDLIGRNVIAYKLILENTTDTKAQSLLGGSAYDFGKEVKEAAIKLNEQLEGE